MMYTLTIDNILRGTRVGPMQSVGSMQVIPLLGDDDHTLAPPDVEVGTRAYGTVELRCDSDRPTLVPNGSGWIVPQKAQDHAVAGGVLLPAREPRVVDTAMCIQQGQGGTIAKGKHAMVILPAALRVKALGVRQTQGFNRLWDDIRAYNLGFGIDQYGAHLEFFLKRFQRELDLFVAEFELVPDQVGAVVMVGGRVVGVERAPSAAFWGVVWEPLVRICYGSIAIAVARDGGAPATRVPLCLVERSLAGLRAALEDARTRESAIADACLAALRPVTLEAGASPDDQLGPIALTTVQGSHLAGQVATIAGEVRFASLSAAA
jgi:hypothetical protein